MAQFKTFINGGNVLPSDLDAMEDDYECSFGTYKELFEDNVLVPGGVVAPANFVFNATNALGIVGVRYLDPARYWSAAPTSSVNPRSVYYNLAVQAITYSTAPGAVSFTASLRHVTSVVGFSMVTTTIAGSSLTFSALAADSMYEQVTADFAAPAAGFYAVYLSTSAPIAASGQVFFHAQLSMRQV